VILLGLVRAIAPVRTPFQWEGVEEDYRKRILGLYQ